MRFFDDTICAPATASGGALAVIRVSGPDTLKILTDVARFGTGPLEANTVRYGEIPGVDQVLASIFKAPHSYTGEDSAEIGCHASPFIISRILELLTAAGARLAEPGEFTKRAFLNGKMDLAQAEAVADVIASSSEAAHRVAMKQLKGGYSSELKMLRDELVKITALMELELDFSEEEVEFADRNKLVQLVDTSLVHINGLIESFKAGNALKEGVPVAIAGAPNSGKSTLLNALVGEERAIVSDIPGTTRDTVEETMTIDGIRYRFIDTAGLRSTDDTIERMGIERSFSAISVADVVIGVLDSTASQTENESTARQISGRIAEGQTLILVMNKADIKGCKASGYLPCPAFSISAKEGLGLDRLKTEIAGSQKDRFSGSRTLVTNLRHHNALKSASEDLLRVKEALSHGIPSDLVAQDLRSAINSLSAIFGEITPDEVLGEIFRKFCIGK